MHMGSLRKKKLRINKYHAHSFELSQLEITRHIIIKRHAYLNTQFICECKDFEKVSGTI